MATDITRDEALIVARHIAAGAYAMIGASEDYCRLMREGRYDDEPNVQSALAALTISDAHLAARLDEIRRRKSNVVEIAA